MKELMAEILRIDREADERLEQVKQQKLDSKRKVDEHKKEIIREMKEYAEKRLQSAEECERQNAEEHIRSAQEAAERKKAVLYECYEKNCDQWTSRLVESIVGKWDTES